MHYLHTYASGFPDFEEFQLAMLTAIILYLYVNALLSEVCNITLQSNRFEQQSSRRVKNTFTHLKNRRFSGADYSWARHKSDYCL